MLWFTDSCRNVSSETNQGNECPPLSPLGLTTEQHSQWTPASMTDWGDPVSYETYCLCPQRVLPQIWYLNPLRAQKGPLLAAIVTTFHTLDFPPLPPKTEWKVTSWSADDNRPNHPLRAISIQGRIQMKCCIGETQNNFHAGDLFAT